ncbi:hypothetical protein T4E_7275 [Trichinella pseudospiralis]|uniref:Uncharacterized protein n=1 Tax=Trichinella pseudospiralis TaxID=6337 RepID=A0A0V0YAY7_TRIPS|nr:hypothetical protein T4E_7275 [Trichinella pseudospiralis]
MAMWNIQQIGERESEKYTELIPHCCLERCFLEVEENVTLAECCLLLSTKHFVIGRAFGEKH